ncbi:hypothetical protein C8A00DRAFT_39611 [Chaetomidium leptoderma]|uniref:Kelch repeat protein n=1 Tax=Chaetomidium leptoderma TaxID=669021 RepID=A0AAN6VWY2_9PEZI|nr:hypothetical protein C8A00DRAFT_39611 [Chaetomidium leptoderma]
MAPRRRASTLLAILGLGYTLGTVTALPDAPSPDNFLRRVGAKATVLGDYVYIDGGELNQLVDGKALSSDSDPVNSTLSIDMSTSWKSTAKSNVGLWTDTAAGAFYSWGGRWPGGKNMTKSALWKFTADGKGGGAWSIEEPSNPTMFNGLHPVEYGAFASTADTGFVIGGVAHAWTEPDHPTADPIPGMATFNMKTKTWQNGTTNFSPFGTGTLNQAVAEYIPAFGPDGLIIALGGYAPTLTGNLNDSDGPPLDLRNLTFFDPETKKRYWQTASGTIPPTPRGQACSSVFPSTDGGYDIFLFGGANGRDKFNYQDAYILSLPGFVWTKVPDPPGGARTGVTCVRVGKRQVLSIGGADNSRTAADAAPQGLLLFDMTAMEWKDSYDASAAEYERAPALKSWYTNGSLAKVEWSSDEVQKLFASAASTTTGTTGSTPPPTGNPITDPTPDPSSGSTPVGAIVGGVVGGIGGLAVIAVVVWVVFIRRRKQQKTPESSPDSSGGPGTDHTPGNNNIPEVEAKYGGVYTGGVPEVAASHGYTEMPAARDAAAPGSTYPFGGPVEMSGDPYMRPSELDATPTSNRW